MKCVFAVLLVTISASTASAHNAADQVVVLHGIVRSSDNMEGLADFLRQRGYDVLNVDYASTDYSLQQLTDIIYEDISVSLGQDRVVHFVGFSMGGLLVRAIIHKYRPQNLGRVVLLATPNNGSEVADFWQDTWLYKKIYGPAGQQLTTSQNGLAGVLGKVDYELGVVAGNFSIDLFSSYLIPGDDDGKVSVESTKVKGMQDHIVVPATHTFFPGNDNVHVQTAHFLKHGIFKK